MTNFVIYQVFAPDLAMTLLVLPHCDIHLALDDATRSSVDFKLLRQLEQNNSPQFTLSDRTSAGTYLTFSPYEATGDRLDSHVTVTTSGSTGTITGNTIGTTFIVMKASAMYIVVRVQVHQSMTGWWFGNPSITTAVDPTFGHAQPSIYARFSDDGNGTDLVGDITGHGFVTLTSVNPARCVIDDRDNRARLRGVSAGNTTISGSYLGSTQNLNVRVIDYGATRQNLSTVRLGMPDVSNAHNMLFLAEGFTSSASDRRMFAQAVRKVSKSLFSARRHEPFGALKDSINVFSAYEESTVDLLTTGYKVKDNTDSNVQKGTRLPPDRDDYNVPKNKFDVTQMNGIVGFPKRGENRSTADLKTLWSGQSLTGYDGAKIDDDVVDAWKASTSEGILEARDGFFGLMLSYRNADQKWWLDSNDTVNPPVPITRPANDTPSNELTAFVNAVYRWFQKHGTRRSIVFDSRRHPPELFRRGNESRDSAVMRYIGASRLAPTPATPTPPNTPIGQEWVPTPGTFIRSRGLVSIIVKDGLNGGTNINNNTLTCLTIDSATNVGFEYDGGNTNARTVMRRKPGGEPKLNALDVINTVAHEFGHSFNLGDEYESHSSDASSASSHHDNVVSFDTIQKTPAGTTGREIDPSLIKWANLPRIIRSARLVTAATKVGSTIELRIHPDWVGPFELARSNSEPVVLRSWSPTDRGGQLVDAVEIKNLIVSDTNFNTGEIVLGGSVPGTLPTAFDVGSMIYVQRKNDDGDPLNLIEREVLAHMNTHNLPLNKDTDHQNASDENDVPVSIDGDFKPPCSSSTLIGLFEGAEYHSGKMYRPAGACKMRDSAGGFCHVCKWLITNRVDPNRHIWVDFEFYPEAKKNE